MFFLYTYAYIRIFTYLHFNAFIYILRLGVKQQKCEEHY